MDAGSLVTGAFSTIVGTIAGVSNANKQKDLEKYLGQLSIQQKTALEARLQDKTNEIERQKILFEALAVDKNIALATQTSKEKNFSLIVVGIGLVVLAGVVILSRKKNG